MSKTAIRDDKSLLPSPKELEARLLYRDACMLILDKPAGIAVHVTAHDKVALDQLFDGLRFGLPKPPGLAHRLDRETSGCLVLGRHRQALDRLGKMFANQEIEKTYLAVVSGAPPQERGIIDEPILKSGEGSKWKMTLDAAGQEAVTHYRLLGSSDGMSLLELSPHTGRTHQVRLHCMSIGCAVVGDKFYGTESSLPMMLHAWKVRIPYYPKKQPIEVTAPIPEHMQKLVTSLDRSAAS